MRWLAIFFVSVSFLSTNPAYCAQERSIEAVYHSLDPNSLTELFAFHYLYPKTTRGRLSYDKAWELINKHRDVPLSPHQDFRIMMFSINPLISLLTKQKDSEVITFEPWYISTLEQISSHLKNRDLKGHNLWSIEETEKLAPEDIDLSRAILLKQYGVEKKDEIRRYEAEIDLMALQVLARLSPTATHLEKMDAINHFIFHEMLFRFPPHSMWAKDVDLYTFLPSVLDSRHGVCLGVSILYLSIAQRIGLPLEIITPPGHIYLAFNNNGELINIETTARGVHYPTEVYLGIHTKDNPKRNLRQVVGLYFVNAAATAWQSGKHETALDFYRQAEVFLPQDPLIDTFMGYNLLFVGKKEEGETYLRRVLDGEGKDELSPNTIIEDYFAGHVDAEGIRIIYSEVNETRESIIAKQKELEKIVEKFPKFREGYFHLAVTWFQLGRTKEAKEILTQYHLLDPENPTVEYYLSILSLERFEYQKAKAYYEKTARILKRNDHNPKALKELRQKLRSVAPMG